MNIKEANEQCSCNISKKVISFLIEKGVLPDENTELTSEDTDKLCIIWLLAALGLDNNKILEYFQSDDSKKIAFLRRIRRTLLDDIHGKQKQLDKLDHIIYFIERKL